MTNNVLIQIVNVTFDIKNKLRKSGLSSEMGSLENCDFLVILENNDKIIGASGVGGLLHVPSLQIHPDFMNKGLGGKLFGAMINEAKKRKYPYLSGSRNPENINAVRLHDFFNLNPIFQIRYNQTFTRDVVFMEFNLKGKIVKNFLNIFNNKLGMIFFIICVKLLKNSLFKYVLTYPPDEFPDPDIKFAIKNFKKII
jgi:GNAT superfamily N-acetyltransferase